MEGMITLMLAVSAISMAAIAISSIVKILTLMEQNRKLRNKLKTIDMDIRRKILDQMSYSRKLWFIDTFCKKDKPLWLKAKEYTKKY